MTPKPKKVRKRPPRPNEWRPTKYKKEYCKSIVEYFNVTPYTDKVCWTSFNEKTWAVKENTRPRPTDFPTLEWYAHTIGVDTDTIVNWTKKHEEFFGAYKKAKALQKHILIVNWLNWTYKEWFAKFVWINFFEDLTDKSVVKNEETVEVKLSDELEKKLQERFELEQDM